MLAAKHAKSAKGLFSIKLKGSSLNRLGHYSKACHRGTENTEAFSFVGAALAAILAVRG